MNKDREIIVKIKFKAHPNLPEITNEEMGKAIISMENNFNTFGPRRIHINKIA